MDVCGRSKARPITCNDSPAFHRLHSSVRCAAESATRLPWAIHTTFEQKFYIRWCCIDPLRSPALPETESLPHSEERSDEGSLLFARIQTKRGSLVRPSGLRMTAFAPFFGLRSRED